MDKVLVLYHSGVGCTKMVSELISKKLSNKLELSTISIEDITDVSLLNNYKILCMGFPTYHASPSKTMLKFIESLPYFKKTKFVFAYTTCALYSANALRIFAKQCRKKNLIVVYSQSYRSPATDGVLLVPNIKVFFKFEKGLINKINTDIENFISITMSHKFSYKFPEFKLYSILNSPNKLLGEFYKPKIHYFKNLCSHCNVCVSRCPCNSLSFDENEILKHSKIDCEHCFRCIHHCHKKALSLNKRRSPKKQLNSKFWNKKKRRDFFEEYR